MPDRTPQTNNELTASEARSGARSLADDSVIKNKYKVLASVAESEAGNVYKVEDLVSTNQYALKIFPTELSDSDVAGFISDAKKTFTNNHPNLATITELEISGDGDPFCVMEFVEGTALANYLQRCGRLIYDDIFSVYLPLSAALQEIHDQGIVYNEVRPSKIMLLGRQGTWHCKLLPFGIDRIGKRFGNPHYMSPEQCSGGDVDHRSDIYSLGCNLFEAITAKPPFNGKTPDATMDMHVNAKPPTLKEASLGRDFPAELERVVQKMLAKEPSQRFSTAKEVSETLTKMQNS